MRILSVQQPWAHAILYLGKDVENRTWATAYRGPLLIHAGRSRGRLGDLGDGEPAPSEMAFGAVVGLVTLRACLPLERLGGRVRSPWAEGPWCWVLTDPRPFPEPVPMKGQMGLWTPPPGFALPVPARAGENVGR